MRNDKGKVRRETWLHRDPRKKIEQSYNVKVFLGKPVDIFSLKSNVFKNFESQVADIKSNCALLYKHRSTKKISKCPVCGASTENSIFQLSVYGGRYYQCSECSHCFILNRPKAHLLNRFYSDSFSPTSAYVDKKTMKTRIEQVVLPKAKWMVKQFEKIHGKKPKSVLDVGAGGGHFVHACRQLGIDAEGIEPNKHCRRFCRENFRFDLKALNFMNVKETDADIITFWGVIEHVSDPMSLLKKARRLLSRKKTAIIAEVPRWDSLSTLVQVFCKDSIVRHLGQDHINFFTDNSLCTAFESSGFSPVAAWYFGMDAYEFFTQLFYRRGSSYNVRRVERDVVSMQKAIDQRRLSDTLVLIGK